MPTLEQIRAARALLGWNQTELAEAAGLSQTGIARIENGTNQPNTHTLKKIEAAFDKADIEFISNTGVKKRESSFRILKGREGMHIFMDDLYHTMKAEGGEFCVFNASPSKWVQWIGIEKWNDHKNRMSEIKDTIKGKIIIKRETKDMLASDYAEYRWSKNDQYDENKTLYSYGNRLAFFDFSENDLTVTIMERYDFSHAFRIIFDSAWREAVVPV